MQLSAALFFLSQQSPEGTSLFSQTWQNPVQQLHSNFKTKETSLKWRWETRNMRALDTWSNSCLESGFSKAQEYDQKATSESPPTLNGRVQQLTLRIRSLISTLLDRHGSVITSGSGSPIWGPGGTWQSVHVLLCPQEKKASKYAPTYTAPLEQANTNRSLGQSQ